MYGTVGIIAEKFNIKPVSVHKCKYYYIIASQQGSFSLSAARPSRERLEYINYYKEKLYNNGFYALDSYILSNENKPYTIYEGNVYTMSKYFGSSELDILSNIQCSIALETIGSMAEASRSIENDRVYAAYVHSPVLTAYEKQINKLYKAKKQLSGKNEFDIMLNKYLSEIINKSENAVKNLKKLTYGSEMTICHNSLKEGNIIYNKGKCRIIDWDNMKISHFLEDCAFFIKRYIRKNAFYTHNTKAKYMDLNTLIKHYTKNNRLSQRETDILFELLNYPHRFVNLILEYCSKNRGFIPSGIRNNINECVGEWEFYYNFILSK